MNKPKFATCFDCYHRTTCFMVKAIDDLISGNRRLNIEGSGAPGTCMDLYQTLALCCLEFKARSWIKETK